MSDRHQLRKLRLLQREVEDSARAILKDPDKFGVQPFGEGQIIIDGESLKGILAFFAGRWDGAKEAK